MSDVSKRRDRPELLAPAGDWEALRAAVANGADAVYFGLSNFNARHRATNFTREELPAVLDYLHRRNVRGYLTLNTLVFSDELEDVAELVTAAVGAGVDAVILQDLGLVRLIHVMAPALPLHASTQMTLTERRGIDFVARLGIERVILARELSLADIGRIVQQTAVPLEVFVHGALCVAYSGQCLTSEALGGRSANRGQCAQACRLPYELFVDGQRRELGDRAYLLSPQDLAAHDRVAELARLGVAGLKIEGRLKSPRYVAVTTRTYRAAINAATAGQPWRLDPAAEADLVQSYSRGFSHGFLDGVDHQTLVEGRFSKNRGLRLGSLVGLAPNGVLVALEPGVAPSSIKAGDGIVFDEGRPEQDEQGGRVYAVRLATVTAPHPAAGRTVVELEFARGAINRAALAPECLVWKTDDPALNRRLDQSYSRDIIPNRRVINFRLAGSPGTPLALEATLPGERAQTVTWPGPLEPARKHPLTAESAREQLGRLGNTPFQLGEIVLELAEPVMVPKSVLNELRRQVIERIERARIDANFVTVENPHALATWRRELAKNHPVVTAGEQSAQPQLYVLARTLEQLDAAVDWSLDDGKRRLALVYCDFEDVRRYGEAVAQARARNHPVGLATLRVSKPEEQGLLRQIARHEPDAFLVRNLAGVTLLAELCPRVARIGDYSLNVANELAADVLLTAGLGRLVPSYDLNWRQLTAMVGRIDAGVFEVVVHQHMPMFHMEHCVFAALLSQGKDFRDCGRPCDRHRLELRDRAGASFPVLADTGCRNTVFNSMAQSGAEYIDRMRQLGICHFRVELLRETASQVGPLLDRYRQVMIGQERGRDTWRQLRVLNQLGVTRGTLTSE